MKRSCRFSQLVFIYVLTALLLVGFALACGGDYVNKLTLARALAVSGVVAVLLISTHTCFKNFGVALLFTGGALCLPLVTGVSGLFVVLGIAAAALVWIRRKDVFESFGRLDWLGFSGLLIIGAGSAALVLSSDQSGDWFFDHRLLAEQVYIDPLFHSAIASMMKNYGAVSTGLHGLGEVAYHAFSHYLFAALSYSTGTPIVGVYGTMYCIVVLPLLLISVMAAAEDIRPAESKGEFYARYLFTFAAFAGFFGYHAGSVFQRYALWDSYFRSESYTVALIGLLGLLSTLRSDKRAIRLLAGGLLLVCITGAKVSVGAVSVALFVCHLALFDEARLQWRILSGAVWVAAAVFVGLASYPISTSTGEIFGGEWFRFLITHSTLTGEWTTAGWWASLIAFHIVHFFFPCLLALLVLVASHQSKKRLAQNAEGLVLTLVAVMMGWIALVFLELPAGAAYYVSNVSMFVALPFILVVISGSLFESRREHAGRLERRAVLLMIALGCCGLVVYGGRRLDGFKRKMSQSVTAESNASYGTYVAHLKAIRDDPSTRDLAVYIAKEEDGFWGTAIPCDAAPFVIPAIAERPAIFGLPDRELCDAKYYGYEDYVESVYELSKGVRLEHSELLAEAERLGLGGYVDVTSSGSNIYRLR